MPVPDERVLAEVAAVDAAVHGRESETIKTAEVFFYSLILKSEVKQFEILFNQEFTKNKQF